jgi:pyruvate dehydrogenase E1 component
MTRSIRYQLLRPLRRPMLQDLDPVENQGVAERAPAAIVENEGRLIRRGTFFLRTKVLLDHARGAAGSRCRLVLTITPYCNTTHSARRTSHSFPGNLELGAASDSALVRWWNALAMVRTCETRDVVRTGRGHICLLRLGGGLCSEVGNSITSFRAGQAGGSGVLFFFPKPHSATGIYSRAFLEGRLRRREAGTLPPRSGRQGIVLPTAIRISIAAFWLFPTGLQWALGSDYRHSTKHASCAIWRIAAILETRAGRKVWAFCWRRREMDMTGHSLAGPVIGRPRVESWTKLSDFCREWNCISLQPARFGTARQLR